MNGELVLSISLDMERYSDTLQAQSYRILSFVFSSSGLWGDEYVRQNDPRAEVGSLSRDDP